MNKKKIISLLLITILSFSLFAGCGSKEDSKKSEDDVLVIRVNNWEEYIDEGDWDDEELIDLESGDIIGVSSMVEDFEAWYKEVYGKEIRVEYSTFGTNEDLYNQLNIGDVYDLVCPSDYLIMKLMADGELTPFSDEFFDTNNEYNYYTKGVSPYIKQVFEKNKINDEAWSKYAAGYMWGTTGVVYNPEFVTKEEASSWNIFTNDKFSRQITIKDNVRDTLFAAMGIYNSELFMTDEFINKSDRNSQIQTIMNDTSADKVAEYEKILKQMRDVAYSFETDSGKSDMVTGKVVANYQWSGDAVYTLDQAEEDDVYLNYEVPAECSNLWFDGWVMLNKGINGDPERQQACEAFINFLSRPDNAVRNMYYIGYTSTIAGGDDPTVFEYAEWTYAAEDDEEELVDYDVSYFFGEDHYITASAEQVDRQLGAQYPTEEIMDRCAVMWYFDKDASKRINQMWINVRCFDMSKAVAPLLTLLAVILVIAVVAVIYLQRHKVFNIKKKQ